MKALVKSHAAVGLWQEDRPTPEIGPEDVVLDVGAWIGSTARRGGIPA